MLVLTLLLFHKGRKHQPGLMLAIYASVEVLTNGFNSLNMNAGIEFFNQFPFMHFIYKPLYCLWVPLFYFYFRYCYDSKFRLSKQHWAHFLPFGILMLLFSGTWLLLGNGYIRDNLYREKSFLFNAAFLIDLIVKIQYLYYNLLMIQSLWVLERLSKTDNHSIKNNSYSISWLRFIVYGYAIGSLGSILSFVFSMSGHILVPTISLIIISYYFLFFFAIFYQTISHRMDGKEETTKPKPTPDSEMLLLMQRIEELVLGKKMYLEPELSIRQIAIELHEKERSISHAINTIQNRNVNDYINSFRIEHACRLLANDKEKPVFEVMYDSGFNTKAAFNQVFKKITGETPTQYRNSLK